MVYRECTLQPAPQLVLSLIDARSKTKEPIRVVYQSRHLPPHKSAFGSLLSALIGADQRLDDKSKVIRWTFQRAKCGKNVTPPSRSLAWELDL